MHITISIIFVIGFLAIMLEKYVRINKAASALLTAAACWTAYILSTPSDPSLVSHALMEHLGDISSILFFLLGAMTIVELIDAHDGFEVILAQIKTRKWAELLWIIGMITFFLSAVLDNLTTTIVMVSMIRKLIKEEENQMMLAGLVIIAANAGGAWSPIGDVTTTMLWIGGQISAIGIMQKTFIPSLICTVIPITIMIFQKRNVITADILIDKNKKNEAQKRDSFLVLTVGFFCLLGVPVFKMYTQLPPFMGMLAGLGIMWVVTGWIHHGKNEADYDRLTVNFALRKIDTPSILFFLGILASVAALDATGILELISSTLDKSIGDERLIVFIMGVLSAVVDNVPLVAAAQGMYDLTAYPMDHPFWELMAYATGTGGSNLIIGSAAGVAAMGMLKMDFFWYLRRISLLSLAGFTAGFVSYLIINGF